MQGHEKVITTLNELLSMELAAINQYMVHSEMCEDWGYQKLHGRDETRAIEEMKHAERLIGRILFLEGMPVVNELAPIHVGEDIETQHKNDWQAEREAITAYNEAITLARELNDNGTEELLESILTDEEEHIDWLEAQLEQIEQVGLQNYLLEQIG
jgi:bacterioferritin